MRTPFRPVLAALAAAFLLAAAAPAALAAGTTVAQNAPAPNQPTERNDTMADDHPRVKLTTNKGEILVELYEDKAPETVENFLTYVRDGYYDGTIFHRVIPDFMIQGGGFTAGMSQKSPRGTIQNEADNGLENERGTLAMARTSQPHSATSQFFINLKANDFLNHTGKSAQGWGYAVFGKVVEGMDVVDAIAQVRTGNKAGHQNVPVEPVVIESATVVE